MSVLNGSFRLEDMSVLDGSSWLEGMTVRSGNFWFEVMLELDESSWLEGISILGGSSILEDMLVLEGSSILECMSVLNDSPWLEGISVLGGSSIFEDMPVLYLFPISSLLNSILLLDAGSLPMVSSTIFLKGTIVSFSMLVLLQILYYCLFFGLKLFITTVYWQISTPLKTMYEL